MTVTLDPPSPALTAARTHHDDLRAGLTELTESFMTAVADGGPTRTARDRLVRFLRTELLPHVEAEKAVLYGAADIPATALLTRAMHDEHRMMAALVKEVEQSTTIEAVIAAGALVVLCDVRIHQENEELLPSLAAAGLDLDGLFDKHPEIAGPGAAPRRERPAAGSRRTLDLRGVDFYNKRHRLYTALRALAPGEEVRVISDRPHDLTGLRYDMEERIAERYSWITQHGDAGPCTIVRRPSSWSDEEFRDG
ncbi:MAG: hemerythrin domain-containing protein [Microlunatus sp.]|nr:hemerythrin domain-containing protein [Microlunatus sp.]